MRRMLICLIVLVGLYSSVMAQSGGQFCVRSFEDRNRNGQRDGGEPLLTRGISVNLQDESGVTIRSALLDNSAMAFEGVVCFDELPAGQYSVVVTSADYEPTTTNTFTTTVNDSGQPAIFTFGAQTAAAAMATITPGQAAASASDLDPVRLVVSLGGALVVSAGMIMLGLIVYLVAFRGRPQPMTADQRRTTTGSMRAVRVTDTDDPFTENG